MPEIFENDITKKVIVSGRVQGVFYRATTRDKALSLGLRGYAKNLPDGTVEVLAVGEEQAVTTLLEWLWTGSRASKVSSVSHIDLADTDPGNHSGFITR